MSRFPDLTGSVISKLKQLRSMIRADPTVLDDADCPYKPDDRTWLRMAFGPPTAAALLGAEALPELIPEGAEGWADVATKTRELYRELEALYPKLHKDDTSEKVQVIKAQVLILDRLITTGEKAMSLKTMTEFQDEVLVIMEQVLTSDQRTDVMERLRRG